MSAMVEDTNEVPHADYGGDLLAGDKVKISGLTSEKGLKLNGCTGFIVPLNLKNDGTFNPTLACRPDGKYQVRITNTKSGRHMNKMETKVYIMKRKNLNPTKVSPSSIHRMEGGKAALEKANIHMGTTAEHEANLPVELRGLFPAIMQGDHVKLRKILEYLKKTHSCVDAAEHYLDAAGNTAIFGAIEHHHVEILQVLIEYGADVNRCNMIPFIMDLKLSPLIMALMVIETERIMGNRGREILKRMETIVNLLLDAGADPSHHSGKGTPLIVASQITGQHEMRLRLIKRLLDAGADVNASYVPLGGMADTTLLAQITTVNTESYTKEETLEVVKLLLKNGADPGKIIQSSPYEKCTVIQIVASMQMPQILECMLSFPKGRAAVDIPRRDCSPPKRGYNRGDKETSLLLMVGDIHGITKSKLTRECIIILLKYGADPSIEDENGISANKWLNSSKEHIELGKLIKKSKNQDPLTFWEIDPDVQAFIVGSSHHKIP
jgi:hypothetical protein